MQRCPRGCMWEDLISQKIENPIWIKDIPYSAQLMPGPGRSKLGKGNPGLVWNLFSVLKALRENSFQIFLLAIWSLDVLKRIANIWEVNVTKVFNKFRKAWNKRENWLDAETRWGYLKTSMSRDFNISFRAHYMTWRSSMSRKKLFCLS